MPLNHSGMWNVSVGNDLGSFYVNINSQIGYLFGFGILLVSFIAPMLIVKGRTGTRMMVSSFSSLLTSLFLIALGMIPSEWALVPAVAVVLSSLLTMVQGASE